VRICVLTRVVAEEVWLLQEMRFAVTDCHRQQRLLTNGVEATSNFLMFVSREKLTLTKLVLTKMLTKSQI
jgi:hypothetical protein